MKANRAFFSGLLGGIVLTILLAGARVIGISELNLEMTLGTLGTTPDLNAWTIGFVLHLMLAGVFALVYGQIFEHLARAGVGIGLLVGLLHAVVVGIVLGFLTWIHPVLGAELPAPGFFAAGLGLDDVLVFLAVHMIFGMLVGVLYEKPLHAGAVDYRRT